MRLFFYTGIWFDPDMTRDDGFRRRRDRKRARGSRTSMPVAVRPGERRSLDFVSDTFGAPRKFHMLAVSDDCCRENLCLVADTSISGAHLSNVRTPEMTLPKTKPQIMKSRTADSRYE